MDYYTLTKSDFDNSEILQAAMLQRGDEFEENKSFTEVEFDKWNPDRPILCRNLFQY